MSIYLAHGASGNAESMAPYVDGLRSRGLDAHPVQLPVGKAEKAVSAYQRQVAQPATAVIGGQSYGGRVASLLAAEERVRGLVLLSYPLHRPGRPEWEPRTSHWPSVDCPVLLLSGEADPFCRMELMRLALGQLASAELITYPGIGHGLLRVVDDVIERIAAFEAGLG